MRLTLHESPTDEAEQLRRRRAQAEGAPLDTAAERSLADELQEAYALYQQQRGDRLTLATDPGERYEAIFGTQTLERLVAGGDMALLFRLADEAFELAIDRRGGAGRGREAWGYPLPPAPIHQGELGGLDGTSCRGCHFSGGPDGAGSGSQLALLRGDGERLSTASLRDPPPLMGAGPLMLLAQQLSATLQAQRDQCLSIARIQARQVTRPLSAQGISFGALSCQPTGEVDSAEVRGVSSDLQLRPFGWKGRHHDLALLSDEALQLHHGLQSGARISRYWGDERARRRYLGAGGRYDPDEDGVQGELRGAQSALLGAYLSLLPVPSIRPPKDFSAQLDWAAGRAHFTDTGCAECHRPRLWVIPGPLTFSIGGRDTGEIQLPRVPAADGAGAPEPQPRRLDFAPAVGARIPRGIPLFAFTDLRRHKMGPALAEPRSESPPDGSDPIPGDQWRTPALWGLADSAPYLHDGRAQTIEEAILAHGGEAEESRRRYLALALEERGALRLFLSTLSHPAPLIVE